jgi:hypothetical protein
MQKKISVMLSGAKLRCQESVQDKKEISFTKWAFRLLK